MNHDVKAHIESEPIQAFIEDNPNYYLANLFIPDSTEEGIEVGLYNPNTETMKTWGEEGVETSEDLARTGRSIEELTVTENTLSFASAVNHARAEVEQDEPLQRIMGVLQQSEKPSWTVTLITTSYTVHTVRLHGETGEHIETTTNNMMSWVKT